MKKSKLLALLGAAVLTFGIVGTAFAATPASDQGVVPTEHDGNITLSGNGNPDGAACDVEDGIEYVPPQGEDPEGGSDTTDNGVTVTWTYDAETKEVGFTAEGGLVTIAYVKGGNAYNEYDYTGKTDGGVASDGGMFAPNNASGGPAGLSHLVFCTEAGEESAPPPPSPSPEFSGDEGGLTECPCDTIPGTQPTSSPADGAWMLVVALGVLLASIVVLTPARAKRQR
jgi:hypothetical protein